MIVVKICGGLGNQLFQYAIGRTLTGRCGTMLKLELSGVKPPNYRTFALDPYKAEYQLATASDVLSAFPRVQERGLHFQPEVLKVNRGAMLEGYWQSEKYFSEISERLREELDLKDPVSPAALAAAVAIRRAGPASVAVHVRRYDFARGDNWFKAPTGEQAGVLPQPPMELPYFERAIAYLESRLELLHLFVFSNHPEWCRDHLRLRHPMTIVDAPLAHEALWLMSQCRHGVMSNSTLSWWANWLPRDPHRIVVAPAAWFTPGTGMENPDLVPARWVQL